MTSTPREEGFVATDALVALLILSTTLALSLSGVTTARHLSEVAAETSEAARLAEGLMARADTASRGTGRQGQFSWRLESTAIPDRTDLCDWRLVLQSRRDRRTYDFTSIGACA